MMNTGSMIFGRPSFGSWVTYGLGSEADDLPAFVVFSTGSRGQAEATATGAAASCPRSTRVSSSGTSVIRSSTSAIRAESMRRLQQDSVRTIGKLNRMRLRVGR
jgi:hypothetical protein